MEKKRRVSYLHIIPFDYGYSFFDYLKMDNSKNLDMTEQFVDTLSVQYSDNNAFTKSIKINSKKKNIFECFDKIVSNAIFHIELARNLYLFVLLNGTGCFLIFDEGDDANGIKNQEVDSNEVFRINAYKRKVQDAILEGDTTLLTEPRDKMISFLIQSRDALVSKAKGCKIKQDRKCSGRNTYKYDGMSYVLTVYLMENNYLNDAQKEYLMYAPFSGYSNDTVVKDTENEINNFKIEKRFECKSGNVKFMFSWSAVLAELDKIPSNLNEVFGNMELVFLARQEVYVQSRWFLADNAIDNAIDSYSNKLEGLQKLLGRLEYDEAKLDNKMSANMSTEEKEILQMVIQTSDVKQLYSSAQHQIKIQSRIRMAYEEKLKKRRLLIASLFMAIFTASSFYNSINAIMIGASENTWLFISMLGVAIAAVLFDFFCK